jgi:hypothetical protein
VNASAPTAADVGPNANPDAQCLPPACEDPAPHTQGFWRRVCKKNHPDQPDRSILTPELCEDLNPDPHSDPCERARSQCNVDATGDTVDEAIAAALALIDEGTNTSCKEASALCGGINEGGVSP